MIERKEQLDNLIQSCQAKLKKLSAYLEDSDVSNTLYNKILIEKAVYKAELDSLQEGFFKRLLKSTRSLNPTSRHLICDYFK